MDNAKYGENLKKGLGELVFALTLKCTECGYEPRPDEVSIRSFPKCPKCGSRIFIKVSPINPRFKTD